MLLFVVVRRKLCAIFVGMVHMLERSSFVKITSILIVL